MKKILAVFVFTLTGTAFSADLPSVVYLEFLLKVNKRCQNLMLTRRARRAEIASGLIEQDEIQDEIAMCNENAENLKKFLQTLKAHKTSSI